MVSSSMNLFLSSKFVLVEKVGLFMTIDFLDNDLESVKPMQVKNKAFDDSSSAFVGLS